MTDIWAPLEAEFERWRDAGKRVPFWWRDDDAVTVTPQLEKLSDLSKECGCDVHLAVIPSKLQPDLPEYVLKHEGYYVLTHGFGHVNHAPKGQKKCEFSAQRNKDDVWSEIEQGMVHLSAQFGDMFAPIFVPPWNRFADEFTAFLPSVGYLGLSTFTPRKNKWVSASVEQINTHVDPIDWHGSRSVAEPAEILAHTVRSLQDRRHGIADNTEPFGFLTHHLVHDSDIWAFSEEFLLKFVAGPTDLWTAQSIKKEIE